MAIFFSFGSWQGHSWAAAVNIGVADTLKIATDTLNAVGGDTAVADSVKMVEGQEVTDSLKEQKTDTVKFVRHFVDLDNSVKFSAKDSLVFFGKNNAKMFGTSEVT